jgi:hypothetical protein
MERGGGINVESGGDKYHHPKVMLNAKNCQEQQMMCTQAY